MPLREQDVARWRSIIACCGARPARHTHPNGQTIWVTDVDDDGNPAVWGEHVGDAEYASAPPIGD